MQTDDSSTRLSLRRPQDGAVLVVVLLAMIGLLGMGLAGLYLTSGSIQMSSNINMRNQALYVAEAGLQTAKAILNRTVPGSPNWQPNLAAMLTGSSPSGVAIPLPSGFVDRFPGDSDDPTGTGCLGTATNGTPTPGAYLRDEDPPPSGFGCQTDTSTTPQPVYINCNYPSTVAHNEAPPDPNTMSAAPTQYMGKYTLFIRQDLGECRQQFFNQDFDGIVVIRSEATASDNRTKVVLEATMSTNPNTQILSQGIATVCPAGAAGCDDNSSVQQGITVGSPTGSGGASGTGGTTGSPWTPCSSDHDCPAGSYCCDGACMDQQDFNTHCGECGATGSNGGPCGGGHCCNGVCCSSANTCCSTPNGLACMPTNSSSDPNNPAHCGLCGTNCQAPTTSCCLLGGTSLYTCTNPKTDNNNCGGCGNACSGSTPTCCNGSCCSGACCNGKCVDTTQDNKNCGQCGNVCSGGIQCCASQCCSGSDICCEGACQPNPSCRIATIGISGPWDGGILDFQKWLKQLSYKCTVPNLDVSKNTVTMDTLDGLNANVIILLDVIHNQADLTEKMYYIAKPINSYYYGAGDGANYANLILADPNNPGRAQMRVLSTTGANNEAQVLGTWVRQGGGLATTVGISCEDIERKFPNKVLQYATDPNTPANPSTSFTPTNSNIVYINATNSGVCVGRTVQSFSGTWAWSGYTEAGANPNGFKRYPSDSTLIPQALTQGVTQLEMQGMFIVWTALADSLTHPTFSAYASLNVNGVTNSDQIYDPSGKVIAAPYLIGIAGEFGSGRLNVWGDEWITYDAVWTDYDAKVYWKNVVQWLGQCSLPSADGGSSP
jgi:hypothetical protein